jgi:hypothetical protein
VMKEVRYPGQSRAGLAARPSSDLRAKPITAGEGAKRTYGAAGF